MAVEIFAESADGAIGARRIADERVSVPAHFDAEVYGALRKLLRRGAVDRRRLQRSVELLAVFGAERVALSPLLLEAHRLSDRLAASDAFYVALARACDCLLLTTDGRLADAAAGLARVELVAAP